MKLSRTSARFALIIALAMPVLAHAQDADIDYVRLRDTLITRTCGTKSLDDVMRNQAALDRIDPDKIRKGVDLFHYDAAMVAYTRFGLTGDTLWLDRAIASFRHAAEANRTLYEAMQGMAICHYLRGDCPAAVNAVHDFRKSAPRKYRNDPQLDDILDSCAARQP
jgi:hypothetical protein